MHNKLITMTFAIAFYIHKKRLVYFKLISLINCNLYLSFFIFMSIYSSFYSFLYNYLSINYYLFVIFTFLKSSYHFTITSHSIIKFIFMISLGGNFVITIDIICKYFIRQQNYFICIIG